VDARGRAFVAAGNQLLRLNSDLVPEQNITLSSVAVNISLSSGGEWLVVCTADFTCAVHNASDLEVVTKVSAGVLNNADRVALFTADNDYYVGSYDPTSPTSNFEGFIRLGQTFDLEAPTGPRRSTDYGVTESEFQRDFYGGFLSGSYAYYLVLDREPNPVRDVRIMRVCHVTSCPGGGMACEFTALYEDDLAICGNTIGGSDDGICGFSVVEDFAGTSGRSIVISRCREESSTRNTVCLVSLAAVDRSMDARYNRCRSNTGESTVAWLQTVSQCSDIQVSAATIL